MTDTPQAIRAALARVVDGESLSREDMSAAMKDIMLGRATQAQIGAFLVALRMKGETVDEIAGAVSVMRELATAVQLAPDHLVDTCGTGGDGARIFNVSTAAAFVVAAAGGRVAKHGNRSISGNSGSADVLEQAGVRIDLNAEQVAACVNEIGVGFMFAPNYHGAMRYAIGPRKELGLRTIFNLLGPLTNPAGAPNQVVGVFDERWLRPVAEVLGQLGSRHVLVVHATDGLDEISIAAPTLVAELKDGTVREYEINPQQFGMAPADLSQLVVEDSAASLKMIRTALGKQASAAQDMLALNAGAAIYVAGLAGDLADGISMAQDAVASGLAAEKMKELAAMCACFD